jgi:tetratricopeptide (TPR) repeat protein
MQDEIVSRLANRLGQELARAEAGRAERSANPDSMDHYFLGRALYNKGFTADLLNKAHSHFDRALDLDPDNVDALVWRAWVDIVVATSWFGEDRRKWLRSAEADSRKAVELRPDDANTHCVLGVSLMFSNRAGLGIAECEAALAIDRNLPVGHWALGMAKHLVGHSEETEAHILEALRISPRDSQAGNWSAAVGLAKLASGHDEEAVVWLNRSVEFNPTYPGPRFFLAAALAHLGRLEDAGEATRVGIELNPGFTIARLRSSTFSDHPVYLAGRERIYEGMRMAGVPEGRTRRRVARPLALSRSVPPLPAPNARR